jgi:L-fuculose-phosphate aldolase
MKKNDITFLIHAFVGKEIENIMKPFEFQNERKIVADYMNRLYDRQLTTASGGNISLRIDDEKFCITPSSLDKGNLTPDLIAVVKFDGTNLTPHLPLSIETEMHRMVLEARPDMQAVVHAHPTYASAYSTVQPNIIDTKLTAEAYCVIGEIVNVPYKMMGTKGLAEAVAHEIKTHKVLLMENHGAIAVGKTMLDAFDCLELLEKSAMITYITRDLPESHSLSKAQIAELDNR